jgi:filamentous hemagglutinin
MHFSGGDGGFGVQMGYHGSSASNGQAASRAARSILSGGEGISIHAGWDSKIVAATIVSNGKVKIDAGRDKILAGVDTDYSYQSNKEVFAGLQLKVSQNVTGAMRQIAQTPGLAKLGYGNPAYQAIGAMSAALNLTQGVLSLTNPTVSASLTLGASGTKSHSEAWSETAVGTTIKAASLDVTAKRDVRLQGVQANVTNDILIDAGRHATIESAQSRASLFSTQSSWNVGVGVGGSCGAASGCTGGVYVEGGASQAKASSWSETQLNTHLNAGGKATLKTGSNATLAGAVVTAKDIEADVGGNLTVASRQDTAHGSSSSSSVGGSLTIGIGTSPVSGTLDIGGGRSSSDKAWVTEQTGLYAKDKLDVRVEKHTQLNGGVLNSDTRQLTLDTNTLGFKDIQDHDRATSASGQVGVGIGLQQNGTGKIGQPSVTVSGSYASHDIEQVTQATIGAGTIIVRDTAMQKQDVKDISLHP